MLDLFQYADLQKKLFLLLVELPVVTGLESPGFSADLLSAASSFRYNETENSDTLMQEYLENVLTILSNDLVNNLRYLLRFTWFYTNEGVGFGNAPQAGSCDDISMTPKKIITSLAVITKLKSCLTVYYEMVKFFRNFLFQEKNLDLSDILNWLLKIPRDISPNDTKGCMLVTNLTNHTIYNSNKLSLQCLWLKTFNDLFRLFPVDQLVIKSSENFFLLNLRCELLNTLHLWLFTPLACIRPFNSIEPDILESIFELQAKLLENLNPATIDLTWRMKIFRFASIGLLPCFFEDIMNHPSAHVILNHLSDSINNIYRILDILVTYPSLKKNGLKLSYIRNMKSLELIAQELYSDKKMEFAHFRFSIHMLSFAYLPLVDYFDNFFSNEFISINTIYSFNFSEQLLIRVGQYLATICNDNLNQGLLLLFPILTFIDISLSNITKGYEWQSLFVSLSLKMRDLLEFLSKDRVDSISRRVLYLIISARPRASISLLYNELVAPCSNNLNKLFLETLYKEEMKHLFISLDRYPEYINFLVVSTRRTFLTPEFKLTESTNDKRYHRNQDRIYLLKSLRQFIKYNLDTVNLSAAITHTVLQLLQSVFEVPSSLWLMDSNAASLKYLVELMLFIPALMKRTNLEAINSFESLLQAHFTCSSLLEYDPQSFAFDEISTTRLQIIATRLNILTFLDDAYHHCSPLPFLTLGEEFLKWFADLLEVGNSFNFFFNYPSLSCKKNVYNLKNFQLSYELLLLACANLMASSGTLETSIYKRPNLINLTAFNFNSILPIYITFITKVDLVLPVSYFHIALAHSIVCLEKICFVDEEGAVFLYRLLAGSLLLSPSLNGADSFLIVNALRFIDGYLESKTASKSFKDTKLYKFMLSSTWFGDVLLDSIEPIFSFSQSTIDLARIIFFNTLISKLGGRICHIMKQELKWKIKEFIASLDHAKMCIKELLDIPHFQNLSNNQGIGENHYSSSFWQIQLELMKTLLFITTSFSDVLSPKEVIECKKITKYLKSQLVKIQKYSENFVCESSNFQCNSFEYINLNFDGNEYYRLSPLSADHSIIADLLQK